MSDLRLDQLRAMTAELSRIKAELDEAVGLLANYERMLSAKKQDFIGLLGGPSLNEKTRSFLSRMEGRNDQREGNDP